MPKPPGRLVLAVTASCAALTPSAASAQIALRQDPATYSCADYIGAGAPATRERAERMLYWITGYVSGGLTAAAPDLATAWPFAALSSHIHSHLLASCPADPGMAMPAIAERIAADLVNNPAGDVPKSTRAQEQDR